MRTIRLDAVGRILAAAAASLLLGIGASNAATVRLSFDPSFGGPWPDLGFAGEALLQVDANCLSNFGLIFPDLTPGPGDCGPVLITNSTVDLFDLASDPGQTTPVETLTYAPPTLPDGTVNAIVVGLVMSNNMIIGVDTDIFGPRLAAAIPGASFPGGNVWVQFVSNFMVSGDSFTTNPEAFIYVGDNCATAPLTCEKSAAAPITFELLQQVPEPASIALVLAALAAMSAFARRRRR